MQKKATLSVMFCILSFLLITTINTNIIKPAKANIITVPDQYPTIKDAVTAAEPGDTIFVKSGVYKEYGITVNKPLIILGEDQKTTIIDGQGQTPVFTISKENVTISGFTLKNFGREVIGHGIVVNKSNATISNNIIRNGATGIYLISSNYSSIFNNIIIQCSSGIYVSEGSYNRIFRNTIMNNKVGIYFFSTEFKDNIFYLNAFNNTNKQLETLGLGPNFWDNGTVGNYWSDYEGIDTNKDGIGDSPYQIKDNSYDNKPLIIPPTAIPILLNNELYFIAFQSNSTISRFHYNSTLKFFRFNTIGPAGSLGYCNLTISNELFNTPYFILLGEDGTQKSPDATGTINATHTWLYFTYYHTLPSLKVTVVPEFPSPMLLPLLLLTVLIAAFVAKIRKGIG